MAKVCEYDDCNNPVFSRGFCRYHQNKRSDDKWERTIQRQKNKGVCKVDKKKVKKIHFLKPYDGVNDLNISGELELFEAIWASREHVSYLSDKPINIEEKTDFWFNIFAHVLAKGKAKYPKFKLYSKNIILLTPEEHFLLDHCSEDERKKYAERTGCDWSKVYKLRDELIVEYKNKFL